MEGRTTGTVEVTMIATSTKSAKRTIAPIKEAGCTKIIGRVTKVAGLKRDTAMV
jgi:hypothetical protein